MSLPQPVPPSWKVSLELIYIFDVFPSAFIHLILGSRQVFWRFVGEGLLLQRDQP